MLAAFHIGRDTAHRAGAKQLRTPHVSLLTCAPAPHNIISLPWRLHLYSGKEGALRIAQVHGERARAGAVSLGVGVVAVEARPPVVHHAACALAVLHTLAVTARRVCERVWMCGPKSCCQ